MVAEYINELCQKALVSPVYPQTTAGAGRPKVAEFAPNSATGNQHYVAQIPAPRDPGHVSCSFKWTIGRGEAATRFSGSRLMKPAANDQRGGRVLCRGPARIRHSLRNQATYQGLSAASVAVHKNVKPVRNFLTIALP